MPGLFFFLLSLPGVLSEQLISRRQIVDKFNVQRNATNAVTPLQVGNGNFAFGADITGLQTFSPWAIMSTWGWHNFSLPTTPNQTSIDGTIKNPLFLSVSLVTDESLDFTGLDWWTHGRLVNYDQPNPAENDISNWLIQNPQRMNLANIGLHFGGLQVEESDLEDKVQVLNLWTGSLVSTFTYKGAQIKVETRTASDSDTVGISVESDLLNNGTLGLFFDFPYPDVNKFDAPFVGLWNATSKHSTSLEKFGNNLRILHTIDDNSYVMTAAWEGDGEVRGPENGTHRSFLTVPGSNKLDLTANFSPTATSNVVSLDNLVKDAESWWEEYWTSGAFIDLTSADSANATELQRRIILSQYLVAVNSASSYPPQESGLVNNGWYGKFHVS